MTVQTLYKTILQWCREKAERGLILFDIRESNNTYIRFKTPVMETLLPPIPVQPGDWVNYRYYLYEIEVREGTISAGLTVTSLPYQNGRPHPLCITLREQYGACQKAAWKTAKIHRKPFRYGLLTSEDDVTQYLNSQLQYFLQMEKTYHCNYNNYNLE